MQFQSYRIFWLVLDPTNSIFACGRQKLLKKLKLGKSLKISQKKTLATKWDPQKNGPELHCIRGEITPGKPISAMKKGPVT